MGTYFLKGVSKLREIRQSWAVALVSAVIVIFQLWVAFQGGVNDGVGALPPLIMQFGLLDSEVFQGKVWQLFTYAWLHGNLLHFGLNMICLIMLGSRVEQMLGSKIFIRTLFAGIVAGGLGHLPMGLAGGDSSILIGMSGGCVALLLLLTTLSPESRMWPLPVSGRALGLGLVLGESILTLIDPRLNIPGAEWIGAWMIRHGMENWFLIGHSCHLGGALAGWMMGRWILRSRVSLKSLRRQRERREARLSEERGSV